MTTTKRAYLREWRLAKGLTQAELGHRAGTIKSEISRLEKGSRRMTIEWMSLLAQGMGISVEELMTVPPIGFGAVTPAPALDRTPHTWSTASLGSVLLGVEGATHRLVTHSGDDWPGVLAAGDLLIVDIHKTSTATPGLFAIGAGDEVMIRRVTRSGSDITISCENPAYPPAPLDDGLSVLGRVIGHIRRL